MEMKRDLNFEVNTSIDLTKMLTGALMDVRRGVIDHETVKSITLIADKINKNNVNAIEHMRQIKSHVPMPFFEKENEQKPDHTSD
jgi:hypothetical protein